MTENKKYLVRVVEWEGDPWDTWAESAKSAAEHRVAEGWENSWENECPRHPVTAIVVDSDSESFWTVSWVDGRARAIRDRLLEAQWSYDVD